MINIGVTGGSGWVGNDLRCCLQKLGFSITDLSPWTRQSSTTPKTSRFPPIDWIIHLGATTSIEKSFKDPSSTYHNNINGCLRILEITRQTNANLILLSSYIYGVPRYLPIDEQHPVSPTNPYMSSKWLSECICQEIGDHLSISYLILRAFNIYSSGTCEGRLMSDLLNNARHGKKLILNDANPSRDYLYVKDLGVLISKIINAIPRHYSDIYNVGSGCSHKNIEVAETVRSIFGNNIGIEINASPRKNDIDDVVADITKVKSEFGWCPSFDLESGIRDIVQRSMS